MKNLRIETERQLFTSSLSRNISTVQKQQKANPHGPAACGLSLMRTVNNKRISLHKLQQNWYSFMSSFLESLGFSSEFPGVIMKAICIGIEQLSKGQVKQNEHTSGKIIR